MGDSFFGDLVPFLSLTWPSLALLLAGFVAPKVIPRFGSFKDLVQTMRAQRVRTVTVQKFNGQLRYFAAKGEGNSHVQAYHRASLIEQRMRTELDDVVRTCAFWVVAHLSLLLIFAGSLDKVTSDAPSAEHISTINSLKLLISYPVAEILVIVFCFLSLQRLTKEWNDIKGDLAQ